APAKDPRTDPPDTRGPAPVGLARAFVAGGGAGPDPRGGGGGRAPVPPAPSPLPGGGGRAGRPAAPGRSQQTGARPPDRASRAHIEKISRANPLGGTPRIDSELRKLGIKVSPTTVAKYRVGQRHPPSPTWRSFLRNHARDLVAADFFTVPTATFQVLFVCVI